MPSRSSCSAARMPSQVLPSLIRMRSRLDAVPSRRARSAAAPWRCVPSVSKLRRASTSVETRPGTIFRISLPKLTARSIHERFGARRSRRRRARSAVLQRRLDERPVLRLLRRLEQQRRIGRRVLRPVLGDGLDVAGVGHDGGVALERVEQGHRDRILRVGHQASGGLQADQGSGLRRVPRSGQESGFRDQRRGSLVALSFEAILQRCRQAPQHPPDLTQVAQTAVHVGGRGKAESFSNLQLRQ